MAQTTPLRITAEPLDDQRCKFLLSRPVQDTGVRRYTSPAEASGSPVAQAILAIPAICEVVVSGSAVTVRQFGDVPWSALEPPVRYALETVLAQGEGAPVASAAPVDEDRTYEMVAQIFRTQINPAVAQHGGKVELIDVQDGVVVLRMMGGCQGCGMADVTLRQGIETSLKRAIPSLKGIQDITDHASGTNPYFAAGTK